MNDDFQMNFKKKETELKKEMLTIQKDLTSKIEQLTSYKLS